MGDAPPPSPAIVRWPGQEALRRACAAAGIPCLLVVDAQLPRPELGPNEDVVRLDDGERDAAARLGQLSARPASPASSSVHAAAPVSVGSDDRAVRRVVGLLRARPERMLRWIDLAAGGTDRRRVAAEVADELTATGWWVEVLDEVGVVAGPILEAIP